jgi:hypothetical protein
LSILLFIIVIIFVFGSTTVLYAIFKKKLQYWIVSDVKRGLFRFLNPKPKGPIHIMFALVDHFEPGNGNADLDKQKARVDAWVEQYPKIAGKHQDSDGICPQHTFFFPPHYDTHDHLEKIVKLCTQGFGEVEMHLHHDRQKPWPDDEISLKKKILDCVKTYSRYGVFCLPDGRKRYGFIHGDWALANSLKNGEHCGVNDELSILEETGCYADFTFPISNEAQPRLANTIFYGHSCSSYPKGYNRNGIASKAGNKETKGLLFIQGIIGLRWASRTHLFKPSIEQSNISSNDVPFPARIDYWINKSIHVKGKPDWIFIKVHGHGASAERADREILLNKDSDRMFSYFEEEYNDMQKFFLHYVSAREMYNIVKAAECGEEGNPNRYRDYIIPRYSYLPDRKAK